MQIPRTGLIGMEQALQGGLQGSLQTLAQGIGSAQGEIDIGNQGLENQAALAGLRGNAAQGAAFNNYQQSPGQQFLQQQGERTLMRNASAMGGIGGGNIRRELVRYGQGMAAQDFGNQFNRGQQVLSSQQGSASNLANLAAQGGSMGANLITNAAGTAAQGRFTTGQNIAQAASGTTSALANLQNQLGQQQAGVIGQGTTNQANLLSGTGQNASQLQQQLAVILANIGTQTGSSMANQANLAGKYDAAGILGQNTAVQNTINQLMQMVPQNSAQTPPPPPPAAVRPAVNPNYAQQGQTWRGQ